MTSRERTKRWNRRRIRLGPEEYARADAICFITIAVQDRRPVLGNPAVAAAVIEVLRQHARATGVQVHGYCIMPEHIHLVLSPSATCDITTFVGQYKNLAQRAAWSLGVKGAFWQKRFWDHFVRADEQLERVVEYVLNNPVRRGLVDHWRDYAYCGSLVFDL